MINATNALRRDLEIQNQLYSREMEQLDLERTKALRKLESMDGIMKIKSRFSD